MKTLLRTVYLTAPLRNGLLTRLLANLVSHRPTGRRLVSLLLGILKRPFASSSTSSSHRSNSTATATTFHTDIERNSQDFVSSSHIVRSGCTRPYIVESSGNAIVSSFDECYIYFIDSIYTEYPKQEQNGDDGEGRDSLQITCFIFSPEQRRKSMMSSLEKTELRRVQSDV